MHFLFIGCRLNRARSYAFQ